jgi:hypothetical protein
MSKIMQKVPGIVSEVTIAAHEMPTAALPREGQAHLAEVPGAVPCAPVCSGSLLAPHIRIGTESTTALTAADSRLRRCHQSMA